MAADARSPSPRSSPGCSRATGAGWPARWRWPTSGSPVEGDRHRPGRGRRRPGAGRRRRARESHKWASAVAVVAGSPGHGGGGGAGAPGGPPTPGRAWCAWPSRAAPRRPPRGPGRSRRCAWPCPPRGGPTRCWPCSTAAGRWWSARASGGAERPGGRDPQAGGRVAGAGGGRRRRPLRPGGRVGAPTWSSPAPAGRAHPPRRRVRPPGRGAARARPGGRRPAAGRPDRGGGAAEGLAHRGGASPTGPGPAGHGRQPAPGHGGHRGRAVGDDRGAARPRGPPAPRRPRSAAHVHGRAAALGPGRGAGGRGPARRWWRPGSSEAMGEAPVAEGRVPAGLGRGRPRGGRATTSPCSAASCAAGGPVRGRQGRRLRPRRGPAWPAAAARGRGRRAGGGHRRRGGRAAPGRRRPPRSCSSPSRRPTPPTTWWPHGLTPTVCRPRACWRPLAAAARRRGRRLGVHVKVDTGMHRVGVARRGAPALVAAVADEPAVWASRGCGPTWRWPTAGEAETGPSPPPSCAGFDAAVAAARRRGARPVVLHAANSAGAIAWPAARYDLVRCGIALYGELPSPASPGWSPTWPAPGRAAAPGPVAAARGRRRAPARRRRAPLLRPAAPAAPPARWWPRSRSATPTACPGALFDGGLRGADRRPPPPAGRHGDHGPARRRLRPRRRGVAGRRGGAARAPGRRGDHRRRVGAAPRHHRLRGAVRHRRPGCPGSVPGSRTRAAAPSGPGAGRGDGRRGGAR